MSICIVRQLNQFSFAGPLTIAHYRTGSYTSSIVVWRIICMLHIQRPTKCYVDNTNHFKFVPQPPAIYRAHALVKSSNQLRSPRARHMTNDAR